MNTLFNTSIINASNTQIYIEPALNRTLDWTTERIKVLNLTWKIIQF